MASRKARSSASFVVMTSSGSAPAVFEVDAATGGVTLAVPPQPGVSGTLVITVDSFFLPPPLFLLIIHCLLPVFPHYSIFPKKLQRCM